MVQYPTKKQATKSGGLNPGCKGIYYSENFHDLLLFSIYTHVTIALQGYLWHRCGKLCPLDGVNHMGYYEFVMMLFLMVCILNLINKNKQPPEAPKLTAANRYLIGATVPGVPVTFIISPFNLKSSWVFPAFFVQKIKKKTSLK